MINVIEYIENKKIEMRKNNIKEVRQNIESEEVVEKIKNYVERQGELFSYQQVKYEILNNDIVASLFCKNPSRQNISEKEILKLIKCDKLPQSGKNSLRFNSDGDIVHIKSVNVSKSVDCIFNGYYSTQKYTLENGGHQDGQFNDVVDFLVKGSKKFKVAAIVDGYFWENGKRDELKKFFKDNPNVLITSAQEIIGDMYE